jgi:hypothetical protein
MRRQRAEGSSDETNFTSFAMKSLDILQKSGEFLITNKDAHRWEIDFIGVYRC